MTQSNVLPSKRHILGRVGKAQEASCWQPRCCCWRTGESCVRQASALNLMEDLKISKTKLNVQAKRRNCIKNVHSCSTTFNSTLMQLAETKPYSLHSETLKSLST